MPSYASNFSFLTAGFKDLAEASRRAKERRRRKSGVNSACQSEKGTYFSDWIHLRKSMATIEESIMKRVRGRGRGSAATAADFLDLGSRAAVDQSLSRLVKKSLLTRVSRGVYAYPQISRLIGEISPSPEVVAKALARRGSQKLLPSGALAANLLGLSEQVPAQVEYLTDGPPCRVMVKRMTVELKQTTPRNLATAGRVSGVVIQALRFLRRQQVGREVVEQLRQRLKPAERQQLVKDIPYAPAWMAPIFREIAEEGEVVS